MERVRDLECDEEEKHANYDVPMRCLPRGPSRVGGTEVEPGTDRDKREDEPEDVEREFRRGSRCEEVPEVATRPEGDREQEYD